MATQELLITDHVGKKEAKLQLLGTLIVALAGTVGIFGILAFLHSSGIVVESPTRNAVTLVQNWSFVPPNISALWH